MKLEQAFDVAAPVDRVWKALIDVEHVAPCLPGATVTGRNEDGSYSGTFTMKIGPTTASYSGKLEMDQIDEGARRARMHANGTDKRGQGGAKATIESTLSETGSGTHVEVVTDYHITGRLARFGRGGMIEDISERLLREFAKRLQDSLTDHDHEAVETPPPSEAGAATASAHAPTAHTATEDTGPPQPAAIAEPEDAHLDAVALMRSVLADRIRRNPIPVALVIGFLLAILLRRRAR